MSEIKGCEYCAEDKCRLCTLLCDYPNSGVMAARTNAVQTGLTIRVPITI